MSASGASGAEAVAHLSGALLWALERLDTSGEQALTGSERASLLRDLRKSKLRRPDVVLRFSKDALAQAGPGSIEELNLFEQISLASMDVGEQSLLDFFMQKLSKRFAPSSSNRMDRLRGMKLESEGRFDEALELYAIVLKKSPSNMLVMKRVACVHRQKGDIAAAVAELHKILKLFSSDAATWLELSEIHLGRGEYAEGAHCLEELVMLDPECAHYHARLADTYYTIGGSEHLLLARKHYTMSLNRQHGIVNLRALYGLMAACRALQQLTDLPAAQKDLTKALFDFAKDTVVEVKVSGVGGRRPPTFIATL